MYVSYMLACSLGLSDIQMPALKAGVRHSASEDGEKLFFRLK